MDDVISNRQRKKVLSRWLLVVLVTGIELLPQLNIFILSSIRRYCFSKNNTMFNFNLDYLWLSNFVAKCQC